MRLLLFVAAWDRDEAIVVFSSHAAPGPRFLSSLDIRPPSDGLWMYEVTLEGQSLTDGAWRRPTDVEAIAAAAGENPCNTPCGVDDAEAH